MARYIDADALIERLKFKRDTDNIDRNKYAGLECAIAQCKKASTADVVPKSEVDKWYHEYHVIRDELKREKMYHRETEKLADKYCAELQTAKSEVERLEHILNCYALQYGTVTEQQEVIDKAKADVAREIFEEIEEALFNNHDLDLHSDYPTPHYYEELKDDIAELKKKYTEGDNEES